ncbi:uncharacterized protein LOC141723649 isoform X2 [Apium graveolens]|uniref:uncharacterized protein LOC141723649 isoform X2 n=1 Tax=Apium graveolens TaxID=4045 RepID=UPI003D7B4D7F
MGHKKRTVATRSKQSPAVDSGGFVPADVSPSLNNVVTKQNPNFSSENKQQVERPSAEIKLECEKALNVLRKGNHKKALRLMKELCGRNMSGVDLGFVYRVQGTVCFKVSSIIDDVGMKEKFVRNAIESAKKATLLSPNSLEYAHFYANLLCDEAEETREYSEIYEECDRALGVENPVDPALECLNEESLKVMTSDERIAFLQNELQGLMQRANIYSISTFMKSLGHGERLHILQQPRRVLGDPMDVELAQVRRANEVKKATKTLEERRKEIEVRVAAARLLQQKSESVLEQDDSDNVLDQSSGPGQGISERNKGGNVKKNASSAELKDFVQSYWDLMSSEMKMNLLRINVSDIRVHFSLLKDAQAYEVLSEAVSFAEAQKQWNFWVCYKCNEKFSDPVSHQQHVLQEHTVKLSSEMQSVLPQNVGDEWIQKLLSCCWKPLDVLATVKMLEKQSDHVDPTFICESYESNDIDEDTDCFADSSSEYVCDSALQDKEMVDRFENEDHENISDSIWGKCNENSGCKTTFGPGSWPLSDDVERAELLQEISSVLQLLIKHKCLTGIHLRNIIHFAMSALQSLDSVSQLLYYAVDQTPLCICFLRAQELKKVLDFLQDLSNSWGVSRHAKNNNFLDDSNSTIHTETAEKVVLDELNSFLLLDENFMPCNDAAKDDATSAVSEGVANNNGVLDADALLSWIYTGSACRNQVTHWMRKKEQKANEGMKIIQNYEKQFQLLRTLCDRKIGHLTHEKALQSVEDICIEEGKRRDQATGLIYQSSMSVLRKRQKELTESENDVMSTESRYELNVISNILNEAESEHSEQMKLEDVIMGNMGSDISFVVPGKENKRTMKKFLHQKDSWIMGEIQRLKEQSCNEFKKTEEKLLQSVAEMHNLKVQLEAASAHDYRLILVPLLKSFIREHLEDLAEKYATEKSDAAREAFLAELALDSKKHIVNRNEGARHDKSKEKKKNKDSRKTKDVKTIANNEPHMRPKEIGEFNSVSLECDEGHLYHEPAVGGSGVDSDYNEEESEHRKLEVEAEVRKLEETLEYQRMIENQAKPKNLAEGNCWQVPLSQRQGTGFCNGVGHVPVETGGVAIHKISITHSNLNDQIIKPSLSNGVEDSGSAGFNRMSGRRSKREKNSNKVVEGKYQSLPFGQLESNDRLHDDAYLVNGTKTLRQLRAEEEDEERFQADLKRAVCQSLGMEDVGLTPNEVSVEYVNGVDVYGTGLKNEAGEYNCFLNVIIQSLWHIRRFRKDFLRRSALGHVHIGDPCVICALYDIFNALNTASSNSRREAVAPTSLRTALSNLYPESNFFQEAQMNDASEVLAVIFDCIHRSLTSGFGVSDTKSVKSNGMGSWDCANNACVAHSLFGMNILERLNCYNCGLESREMKYTSFFHNINASSLRTMKVTCPESCFGQLLSLVQKDDQFMCDPEVQGCGQSNYKSHTLSTKPRVFTTVLGWQNTRESVDDIRATLAALAMDIDISVLYDSVDPKSRHRLISVVCYYGQHYHCFAYGHDHKSWIMYDDKTVKLIGGWEDVITVCEKGHLQPQVLFFEAVN